MDKTPVVYAVKHLALAGPMVDNKAIQVERSITMRLPLGSVTT